MEEYIIIDSRVKISEEYAESSPDSYNDPFIESGPAGKEGTYRGTVTMGEVIHAIVDLDNGEQLILPQKWIASV